MGAITLGSLAYGATQGVRDARRDNIEEENHVDDRAIRREALEQAPIRRRALELEVGERERQAIRRPGIEADEDELRKLGLDTAKLNATEREAAVKQAREARVKEERLKIGLGKFQASGDPQHIADAMGEVHPAPDGSKPVATRDPDGSISLSMVDADGNPVGEVIKLTTKKIAGVERSPDDQLSMYAYKLANPMEHLKERYKADLKIEEEGVKQEGAITRAGIVADSRVSAAEAATERHRGRATERGIRLGKTFVDSSLKTVSVPGHFTATYSSEDDAKLLPHIYTRMGEIVRKDDAEPEEAAKRAITEVRSDFLKSKRATLDAAERLRKAGIDPKDKAALAAAKAAGNKDVDALLAGLGAVNRAYGPDVGNYLLEQIPAKKK